MYAFKRVKCIVEWGETVDQLQAAINEINAVNGEIIQVIPLKGKYAVIFYKY